MEKILIVSEDKQENDFLKTLLQEEGYSVVSAFSSHEGIDFINNYIFDVVISNISNSNDFEILRTVKKIAPESMVFIIVDSATTAGSVEAIKLGSEAYIKKPYTIEEIRFALREAVEKRNHLKQLRLFEEKIHSEHYFQNISVKSPKMQKLIKTLPKIAGSSANILIKGEVGSGREYLANTIHKMSPRSNSNFVSIHCADDQLESKLFGYIRGAHKERASIQQQGLFEIANGGTIFLEQITETPLTLQLKLFLVLKSGLFGRIGAKDDLKFDLRIICASNKDLSEAVSSGHFREDLFYKLNLIPIDLPPLRERREDIPSLIRAILQKKGIDRIISENALRIFLSYSWKGNLRELESVIERIVLFSDREVITPADIPIEITKIDNSRKTIPEFGDNVVDLDKLLLEMEKGYILAALDKAKGIKTEAARLLNLSFRSFRHKLYKYGIK